MEFEQPAHVTELASRLEAFMDEHVYPNERLYLEQVAAAQDRWRSPRIMEQIKDRAKAAGLWNLFLPKGEYGGQLSNLDYAPLWRIGRVVRQGSVRPRRTGGAWRGKLPRCPRPV